MNLNNPIIQSILDTDLFLFSMQWACIKTFPEFKVRYKLIFHDEIEFPKGFDVELKKQIQYMTDLKMNESEYRFMHKIRYFPKIYIDFLRTFIYNPNEIKIKQVETKLEISLEGYLVTCILWESPLLAIINELYYMMTKQEVNLYDFLNKDMVKAKYLKDNDIEFVDMGTRTRYSFENHDRIIHILSNYRPNFIGTCNVFLAKKYDLLPVGTFSYLWFMVHGALYGYHKATDMALQNWVNVYGGDVGIALTDTFTSDVFFKSFNLKFSKLFDGVRHNSGDPYNLVDKTIAHYKYMKINPALKKIIFSNKIDINKAVRIKQYCGNKIPCSFSVGRNFTNDVGVKPLDIAFNLSELYINKEWVSVIKLSDDPLEYVGDPIEIQNAKYRLKII